MPCQPRALLATTLPRTLEDAITFTGLLGKRYLWIDALCIPQNDPTAKQVQLALMDRIYGDSYCTLIALSGDGAHDGLPGSCLQSPRNVKQHVESTPPAGMSKIFQRFDSLEFI